MHKETPLHTKGGIDSRYTAEMSGLPDRLLQLGYIVSGVGRLVRGGQIDFDIRPGQFVLFAPASYEPEYRMLSSTFFSLRNPPLTVRLVLLACNVIRE